jgi:hypothetical protein
VKTASSGQEAAISKRVRTINRRFSQIYADNGIFVCRETTTNKNFSIADNNRMKIFTSILNPGFSQIDTEKEN